MSDEARSVSEAVERLGRRDLTLKVINLTIGRLTDSQLAELVDCLLAHPDFVTGVYLDGNQLTDETGIKLARYLAASSTITEDVDRRLSPINLFIVLRTGIQGEFIFLFLATEDFQSIFESGCLTPSPRPPA